MEVMDCLFKDCCNAWFCWNILGELPVESVGDFGAVEDLSTREPLFEAESWELVNAARGADLLIWTLPAEWIRGALFNIGKEEELSPLGEVTVEELEWVIERLVDWLGS